MNVTVESILIQALADQQAISSSLREQLADAHARLAELDPQKEAA